MTGSDPGKPRQTGQVNLFGFIPKERAEQEQNILLSVNNST